MIDDFKQPPVRRPTRLDTVRSFRQSPPERTFRADTLPEVPFVPPEEVADNSEPANEPSEPGILPAPVAQKPVKTQKRYMLFGRFSLTRKQLILSALVALLALGGGVTYALTGAEPEPVKATTKVVKKAPPPPPPKPILSPLTGIPVTAEQQALPVTGVMIENSPNARPQSGLKDAGVVFEAIAEAGITRFLALFQEGQPGNVGPVRSARPYYLDWTMAFDASYAHVGGSPDALARIREIGVKDLDQFYNSSAYRRITTRFAPHNVYTDIPSLVALGKSKGYEKSTFTSLVRKEKEAPSAAPTAKVINMNISSAYYNTRYEYSPATNTYNRVMAGAPHMDANTGTQISPKVVVALVMPYSLMADGFHSQYGTVGSGTVLVFQDGIVTAGTWSKSDPKAQFVLTDSAGKPLGLNPGQTWFTAIADAARVTYTP